MVLDFNDNKRMILSGLQCDCITDGAPGYSSSTCAFEARLHDVSMATVFCSITLIS